MNIRRAVVIVSCSSVLLLAGCTSSGAETGSQQAAPSSSSSTIALKTYQSDKFGLEFEYPSNWRLMDDPVNRGMTGMDVIFDIGTPGRREGFAMNPGRGRTPHAVVSRLDKKFVHAISDIVVGGEKGQRVQMTQDSTSYVFVKHGDEMYTFETGGAMFNAGVIDSVRFIAIPQPVKKKR